MTSTNLFSAFVKNILSLLPISFVLLRMPVLLIPEEDFPSVPSTPHAAP
jgi:hypothetical protein